MTFQHATGDGQDLPFDIDIEQALLGAVMADNSLFWRVESDLAATGDEFYDPLHQRLWTNIVALCHSQRSATPLTLKSAMADDAGIIAVGTEYLLNLARGAPALPNVRDYAKILRNLALRRALIHISEDLVNAAFSRDDAIGLPEEIADKACEALYDAVHSGEQGDGPQDIGDLMLKAAEAAEYARNHPTTTYISTGLPCVDRALGGLFPGEFTVLGAAPNMGKSGFVAQIGEAAARTGKRTLIFSLEMAPLAMTTRYAAIQGNVSADKIMLGRVTDGQMDRIAAAPNKYHGLPLHIDGTRNLAVAQMRARLMAMRRKRGKVSLVIIDHLRYVRPANIRDSEPEQIQQITRDLASMGQELGVAVLLVSHLNREYAKRQNHRPIASDLYGSSAIEQNADHIWFLHREEYYLQREQPPDKSDKRAMDAWSEALARNEGLAEIFNVKRRMGGVGKSTVKFNGPLVQFIDPDEVQSAQTNDDAAQLKWGL